MPLVLALRAASCATALEAKMLEEPDERQLEFATLQEPVIYSYNVGDFCCLHSQWLSGARDARGDCSSSAKAVFHWRANEKNSEAH